MDETTPTAPPAETTDWGVWRGRITASRNRREERVGEWLQNVDARKGAGRRLDATTSRLTVTTPAVAINQDWPLTKAKIAQLYSQTPEVRLSPKDPQMAQAVPIFGRELNQTITDVDLGALIEEVLSDVVNASGIGACLVSCETRTHIKQVPIIDVAMLSPEEQAAVQAGAVEIPTKDVEQVADIQYLAQRISPADLLVPDDFTSSNYNKARWLGEDGRMTWAQGVTLLKLTDDEKDQVLGKDKRASTATASLNSDSRAFLDTDVVTYTQLFYWRHFYHADETNFHALQRVVFVDGLDEPKINEPYRAQTKAPDGSMVGVTKNPIRVLTLTYISDDGLPPSDSSIGRHQVNELEDSRESMSLQRKHSIPIRWYDTNRVSSGTKSLLEKGTYQGFIPTNGPGDRAVGEVARASFPPEKYEFDKIIKNDLTEIWQVGTNQAGAFSSGARSAKEAGIIQSNFQRRVGQEQDKVTKFFLGIVDVLAGHLALYGTFALPDALGPMRQQMANAFTYSVRADATVRLDAAERIAQLDEFVNKWGQSGVVNIQAIATERAALTGLDPATVIITPQPKKPEPIKMSISKAEDLMNPLFLASLMLTGQGPGPQELSAAIQLLQAAYAGAVPMLPQPEPEGDPEQPAEVEAPGIHHADWQTQPSVDKRDQDAGA